MQEILTFQRAACPTFQELEQKFCDFRHAVSSSNTGTSFEVSAAILGMKPTVLGFMGTMSHIVSVLQKTRNGLLIDMRRANALADKKEFDKIEAPNSTVVRFYNTNLSVNHCEELLRTNPPSLHYTTVKHLLEILELVKQLGGMKLSPSHFIRKVVGRVAGRGQPKNWLAVCRTWLCTMGRIWLL